MDYITNMDELMKRLDEKKPAAGRLVTENPTPNTQRLYDFLLECRGKRYISGQQYLFESEIEDLVYYRACGRLPAIRGYDFMGIGGLAEGYDQIERAYDWAKNCGGILTMCWHWYAPDDMSAPEKGSSFYYQTTSYSHKTSFDIVRAAQSGTPENAFVLHEIDLVAQALKRFEREDIPVLWRPLHEANGNWFWWGNRGEESVNAYKWLWYTIFDRFMNYHRLTNLIWVWNGQDKSMAVHPNTYDIAGLDIYAEPPAHSSEAEKYRELAAYTAGKPLSLSECGSVPDPDLMARDGAEWLWWLPWWGMFVYETDENGRPVLDESGMPRPNPKFMTEDFLRRVMGDERVVTLDRIPWRSPGAKLPQPLRKSLGID